MITKRFRSVLVLAAFPLAGVVMAPASAASFFDFAHLTWDGTNNHGFLPSDGFQCTGGDLCSSNILKTLSGDLNYTIGGLTATATGTFGGHEVAVVQDHEDGYDNTKRIGAGLGVYHVNNDTSDDNVTAHEELTIKFNHSVLLTELDMRSDGHNTSWIHGATFLFDGAPKLLAGAITGLGLVGNTFTFGYDNAGKIPDQFYLGGMVVTAVPEPETYAMMLAGLGLLGFAARRRARKEAAAA